MHRAVSTMALKLKQQLMIKTFNGIIGYIYFIFSGQICFANLVTNKKQAHYYYKYSALGCTFRFCMFFCFFYLALYCCLKDPKLNGYLDFVTLKSQPSFT